MIALPFTWAVLDRDSTRVPGCATIISVRDTETAAVSILAVANDVHELWPAADFFELLTGAAVRADDLEELRDDLMAFQIGRATSYRDESACDWRSVSQVIADLKASLAANACAHALIEVLSVNGRSVARTERAA